MKPYDARPQVLPANACADLDNLPSESFVSSLWRFAWRNGLNANTLLPYCSEDKYQKEAADNEYWRYDHERFAQASGWNVDDAEAVLLRSSHKEDRPFWWSRTMRYCPICLEHLYHSYWHQCEFLTHCPFDGAPLLDRCYECNSSLPAYGFHRKLLNKPYTCPTCRGPLSGIRPRIEARVAMQERSGGLAKDVSNIEHWWQALTPSRQEIEGLMAPHRWNTFEASLRPASTLRQWVVDAAPVCTWPPISTRTIPRLVVLEWKVRLRPPDPLAWVWAKRKSRYERLSMARQVYRTTLRRLESAISAVSPYTEAEYRRYLILPAKDVLAHPGRCNLHLLAMIVLRMTYESFFSIFEGTPDQARLNESIVDFPYGNEFAERVRICWRAQFIAEYASIYWVLVLARSGRRGVYSYHNKSVALYTADVDFDAKNGDLATGKVGFPAVDGLQLDLFL